MALPFPHNVHAAIAATTMGKLSDSVVFHNQANRLAPAASGQILAANSTASAGLSSDSWTTAKSLTIVTTDAANHATGSGARTVLVTGLDANRDRITETVTLNGTSSVAFVNDYLAINEIRVLSAGTGGGMDGSFSIDEGATQLGRGINRLEACRYTCPNGYCAFVTQISMTAGSDGATDDAEAVVQAVRGYDYNLGAVGIQRDYGSLPTHSHMGRTYSDGMMFLEPGQQMSLTVNNLSPSINRRYAAMMRVVEIKEEHLR